MQRISDPSFIDPSFDSRSITAENRTGARGAGGTAGDGRKGSPMRVVRAGRTTVLAEIEGPGTVRHVWLTVSGDRPEALRALVLEVQYEGVDGPSVSVPLLDFFGCPHGRPVAFANALHAAQEGRGFNSYVPMPFGAGIRIVVANHSEADVMLFYQVDYTLGPSEGSFLHASFRRENPTVPTRDFVVVDGLQGPGRFLGMVGGVRVLDEGTWYGEGEVKVYRDGDRDLPTICGTGLEDYIGSAWGLGAHAAPYGGAPLVVFPPDPPGGEDPPYRTPDLVSFYRWHVLDPVMFTSDLRVTIQQIGSSMFQPGDDDAFAEFTARRVPAGVGWVEHPAPHLRAFCMYERADDYCATAFVYCREPQPVARVDAAVATADMSLLPYEAPYGLPAL